MLPFLRSAVPVNVNHESQFPQIKYISEPTSSAIHIGLQLFRSTHENKSSSMTMTTAGEVLDEWKLLTTYYNATKQKNYQP